jgi:hypothetical protein
MVPVWFAKGHDIPAQKLIPALIYAILYYSSKSIVPGWLAHGIFNIWVTYNEVT